MIETKVSYILSHPIQYFSPLFKELASIPGVNLCVYYCSNPGEFQMADKGFGKQIYWDLPLLDGYHSVFLRNVSPVPSIDNRFWGLINPGIVSALVMDRSDIVIVHGWSCFTNYLAVIAARILGKKVWLRGENPLNQEILKPVFLRFLKKIVLQYGLFKLISRFLYIGRQNRDFYAYYCVESSNLVYAPYAVDNVFFSAQADRLRSDRLALRKKYNLPVESVIFLFSGKYIIKKRPMDLLKAYARLHGQPVALVMVGEGELRIEMENYIDQEGLKNVFLGGFINQSEISNFYALADVFVLPSGSGETWGLVVNEAMLFHLPVIVSATAGCAVDLVRHGENGFVYEEGNIEQLTSFMQSFVVDIEFRERAGNQSRAIVEQFDYSVMIDNIESEINRIK